MPFETGKMISNTQQVVTADTFARRINYELKRAERYRIFVSLVVFNITPVLEFLNRADITRSAAEFIDSLSNIIKKSVREIDTVSNSSQDKIGLLFPETPRQGAEAAARRISETLHSFYAEYFGKPADCPIPVEISSYPDAAGARSLASYLDEFDQ